MQIPFDNITVNLTPQLDTLLIKYDQFFSQKGNSLNSSPNGLLSSNLRSQIWSFSSRYSAYNVEHLENGMDIFVVVDVQYFLHLTFFRPRWEKFFVLRIPFDA